MGFFDPPCLLLGVISTATSVGITASILVEHRKLDSPEGVTILAAAVVDDVLGIIMLAVGMGVITATQGAEGVKWGHIGMIAFKVVTIWLVATAAGLIASRRISSLLRSFGDRATIAALAMGLALIVAGLFEEAGLAMIIGAYVALLISGTALAAGLLEQDLFGVVILMTLVTTVAAPPLLVWLFRIKGSGLRNPPPAADGHGIAFEFPSEETAEFLVQRLLNVFEADGFFVHELSEHEHVYQLLRDHTSINIERHDATIRCSCGSGADSTLVHAAMVEVLADFERVVKELRTRMVGPMSSSSSFVPSG